jgi:hypothetical protein
MDTVLRAFAITPEAEQLPGRDLFTLATYLEPTDAHIAAGCLAASGVPAVVADAHYAQADFSRIPAIGGVRVLVPEAHMQLGRQVLAAYERGDFALPDDTDVGPPELL